MTYGFCAIVPVMAPREIQSSVSGSLSNATMGILPSRSNRCSASAAPSPQICEAFLESGSDNYKKEGSRILLPFISKKVGTERFNRRRLNA